MTTLPLSDIIRDSFAQAWRYKYLWIFGLFAGGAGGGLQFPGGESGGGLERIEEIKAWVLAALAVILLVGFVVAAIVLVLHTLCKTALIYNVYQIETGGAHSLAGGWDFSIKRFWPMLGLTITEWFVLFAFIMVVVLVEVAIFVMSLALGFLSLLVALPLLFIGVATAIVVWTYAERFIVLENRGVVESLGEGWSLAKSEWRATVTILLVKIAIAIALGIGVGGIALILMLPAVGLWMASKALAIVYAILILVPFVALVGGYFGTFDYMVWTKVFLKLRAPFYTQASAPSAPAPPPAPTDSGTPPPLFE
jgi:hypothetical protein